jgi:hypothetical protein
MSRMVIAYERPMNLYKQWFTSAKINGGERGDRTPFQLGTASL